MVGKKNHRFHSKNSSFADYRKNCIAAALEEKRITENDADLIQKFVLEETSSCTPARKYKLTYVLVNWRQFLPEFNKVTLTSLLQGIENLKFAKKPDGEEDLYKRNSQIDYIRTIKRFVLWMIDEEIVAISEKKVRSNVKTPSYRSTKTNEMMLSSEEIRALIEACRCNRDRAFIAMLYESGCRVGELADMTWGQLSFDDWSVKLIITGENKTGKTRYIPLVMSRAYLAAWKDEYYHLSKTEKFLNKWPEGMTPDSFLFLTNNRYQPMHYCSTVKHLRKLAERAGIEKHITLHLFRHSRITHLLQQGVSESIIKSLMWGNQCTDMLGTYGHLSNADTDDAMAKLAGIKLSSGRCRRKTLEPLQCSRCQTINPPTQRFCGTCGLELTVEAVDEAKIAKEQAEMLPEYQELMKEFEDKLRRLSAAGNYD
ncbi:site-specific integrase [Methanoplanus endosymbiosus]|uniref:Site-specific integrase n=1 Tax=Methanoplanus endosymbiosus TaxID=33865 RepID=A0A9E7TMG1_9EURY|nr:site-specific integrase [Methanoplanus endosymbiosus]UUX93226.1 site-specific integrase [Methanoplanus endosymbiosus]